MSMLVAGTVVLELFTSQGCSSCPPADALLAELGAAPDVLALSFHVDYWDDLGWKDPSSSPAWTARQRAYASALGEERVYTPQLVVNGRTGFVGSSRSQAERAVAAARGSSRLRVSASAVRAKEGGWEIAAAVDPGRTAPELTVDVLLVEAVRETAVKTGENAGRTLRNEHVVRQLASAGVIPAGHPGAWSGTARLAGGVRGRAAVLVQDRRTLEIVGAAVVALPD